jgi:hypothetical protein
MEEQSASEGGPYTGNTLEAVGGAGEFGGMRGVLAGFFAAEAWRWEHFSGIAELQRVEGAADSLHGG